MAKLRVERALGYVRVSTQRQADGGISLDNQQARLGAHYGQRGVELVDIYRDGGLSGTTDNRPGLQALFEHAMRTGSGITEIGVYSFSRLFRDHYLLEHYRRKLKRAGVRIVAITQEVGQDAEGDLVRSVLSNFDEYQSRQTAKFTQDTMRRNAEAGFWNGAVPPFGYTSEVAEMRGPKAKKRLAIEPSEALQVQQIYRMKRFGIGSGPMGYKKIVCHLNDSGATLRGRKWHVSNVRDILTRSTYRGKHLYGVHDTRNGVKRPEEEWQMVTAPVIIPEGEWLEVQAGIARNARHITAPTFVSGPTMLAGIAKCGHPECGHALTIATGKGGRYRYYRCSRNLRRGETACQGTSIRDEKLESIVIDAMAERLLRPERLQELLANLLDDSSAAVRERQAHLKALRTERTRIDGRDPEHVRLYRARHRQPTRRRFHRPARQPAYPPCGPRAGNPAGRASALHRRSAGHARSGRSARRGHPDQAPLERQLHPPRLCTPVYRQGRGRARCHHDHGTDQVAGTRC